MNIFKILITQVPCLSVLDQNQKPLPPPPHTVLSTLPSLLGSAALSISQAVVSGRMLSQSPGEHLKKSGQTLPSCLANTLSVYQGYEPVHFPTSLPSLGIIYLFNFSQWYTSKVFYLHVFNYQWDRLEFYVCWPLQVFFFNLLWADGLFTSFVPWCVCFVLTDLQESLIYQAY